MEVVAKDVTGGATSAVAPVEKPIDTKVEAPVEQNEEQLSSKYAAFARQQKAIRESQRQIQEAKRAIAAERQALNEQLSDYEKIKTWRSKLKENPLDALSEDGITYDQLTQQMLNNPNKVDPAVLEIRKELEQQKAERQQERERQQQLQVQQYEHAKKVIRSEAEELVSKDESFEAIKHYKDEGSVDAIVSLIEEVFRESKGQTLMPVEQAAREIEEYLFEKSLSAAGLKKIQNKLNQPLVEEKPQSPQKQPTQTLSNRMVQSTAKPMTNRERRERAIAAFQGKQIT